MDDPSLAGHDLPGTLNNVSSTGEKAEAQKQQNENTPDNIDKRAHPERMQRWIKRVDWLPL